MEKERDIYIERGRGWFKKWAPAVNRKTNFLNSRRGIAPTRNCTHFLKIGFMVAGGGFYSYYIHHGNYSDKERNIIRKRFMHTNRFNTFIKRWVQFRVGAIPSESF